MMGEWIRRAWRHWCALGLCLCLMPCLASAESDEEELDEPGFHILSTDIQEIDKVLRLNAGFQLKLSQELTEALHSGVPLTLVVDMEMWRERSYWLNENVATVVQRYQLEYNSLTRNYLLENINTSARYHLPSLESALGVMSGLSDFPFLDTSLLSPEESYYYRMRLRIDVDTLPVPLRVMAYVSSRWHLTSDWYTWPLP